MSQPQQHRDSSQEQSASAPSSGEAEFDDCTPCRMMGAATFIGLGAYTLTLRPEAPSAVNDAKPFARALVRYAPQLRGGLGAGFVMLGVYRLLV